MFSRYNFEKVFKQSLNNVLVTTAGKVASVNYNESMLLVIRKKLFLSVKVKFQMVVKLFFSYYRRELIFNKKYPTLDSGVMFR
jgi:hypothetical protein